MEIHYGFTVPVALLIQYLFPGGMMAFLHFMLEEMDWCTDILQIRYLKH